MEQASWCRGSRSRPAGQLPPGQPMQLRVERREQRIRGGAVAALGRGDERGDRGRHLKCLPKKDFYHIGTLSAFPLGFRFFQ